MFETAFASKIPVIGIQTDDLVNFKAVLTELTGRTVQELPAVKSASFGPYVFWTDDLDRITVEIYKKLLDTEHQCIVLNPEKKSSLVFDAGTLPTPDKLLRGYLKDNAPGDLIEELVQVLKGLSLKTAGEILMLTMARTGAALPKDVRHTRTLVGGMVQGLYPVDTSYDFYEFPDKLHGWLDLNAKYFTAPNAPPQLVPRGTMLEGSPGVGKSMAAKAVARYFDVPLYRLDIATTMNRYIGESENRVARSLDLIERESPCVLLIDEVEKIFSEHDDSGVTSRILSQLLWWLSDHTSRVLTIMTTNNLSKIPPELYRPGRLDFVMKIPRLSPSEARMFAGKVFQSVVGNEPTIKQLKVMKDALEASNADDFSHAEVSELTYTCIKLNDWVTI